MNADAARKIWVAARKEHLTTELKPEVWYQA